MQRTKVSAELDVFLNPASVAVIGASERPGSWGSFIMRGLLSANFSGHIYPVNSRGSQIFGIPAFKRIEEINAPVDLVVCAVPEKFVEETIEASGRKGVKGITVITAGFAETSDQGMLQQASLAALARSHGMRLIGPNVSGTFNLQAGFNASSIPGDDLLTTPIAAVCQGGYAFYDILSSGRAKGLGVGKFIHTGNESDLTVTDFLQAFGKDPAVKAIIMYIETLRDGKRYMQVAREVTRTKPVVVYKAGRTADSARAAHSHTGALAGKWKIYRGLLRQTGVIVSPSMELLLPIGHALIERPPMKDSRVAIITVGGSWGVTLSDSLAEAGLSVPEFSPKLQAELRSLGMPDRASVKNPLDFGASGQFLAVDLPTSLARAILASKEADALILHGIGRPGMHSAKTPEESKIFLEIEKQQVKAICALEKEMAIPVLIGSHYNPWESQAICDLNKEGIRIYNRLHEIGRLMKALYEHGRIRKETIP
jgi:acetate---CoA ligase (ADP-forming) subunit alpha